MEEAEHLLIERVSRAIDPVGWKWLDSETPKHPAYLITRVRLLNQAARAIMAMKSFHRD